MLFRSFPSFPAIHSASSLKPDPERAFSGGCHTYIPSLTHFPLTFVNQFLHYRRGYGAGLGLTAFYYLDFRNTSKQDVRGLLSSLVQLCAKSDPRYEILSRLYTTYDNGSRLPEDEALVQCLKDMLELSEQPPIYLIVDALDECPNTVSPRDRVLNLIEDLVCFNLPNLRIGPEADIFDALRPLASHTVSLHDEDGQIEDVKPLLFNRTEICENGERKRKNWLSTR